MNPPRARKSKAPLVTRLLGTVLAVLLVASGIVFVAPAPSAQAAISGVSVRFLYPADPYWSSRGQPVLDGTRVDRTGWAQIRFDNTGTRTYSGFTFDQDLRSSEGFVQVGDHLGWVAGWSFNPRNEAVCTIGGNRRSIRCTVPDSVTLAPGGSFTISVPIRFNSAPTGNNRWKAGALTLTTRDGQSLSGDSYFQSSFNFVGPSTVAPQNGTGVVTGAAAVGTAVTLTGPTGTGASTWPQGNTVTTEAIRAVPDSRESNGAWRTTLPAGYGTVTSSFVDIDGTRRAGTSFYYNTYPVTITAPASNAQVSLGTRVAGRGQPNGAVWLWINNVQVGSATTDADGNWSTTITTQPSEGRFPLFAVNRMSSGQNQQTDIPVVVVADRTPPAAPVVAPTAGAVITGTAEPGSTVKVLDAAGTVIGSASAAADGSYSVSLSPPAAHGAALRVTATDASNNVSTPTAVRVDSQPPAAPVSAPSNGMSVTGMAEPGSTVVVADAEGKTIGRGTADGSGKYSITLNPTQPDKAVLAVTAMDATGNVSAPERVIVDALASDAPLVNPTNGTRVSGTAEPGVTVVAKDATGAVIGSGVAAANGRFSFPLSPEQPDRAVLSLTATDASGNESAPTPVTVDRAATPAPHVDLSDGKTLSGTTDPGATVVVKNTDGEVLGEAVASAEGTFSIDLRPAQPHGAVLSVTATDEAGNGSPATPVTVDAESVPPVVEPTGGKMVTGSAEPGATVVVTDSSGAELGRGSADDAGRFAIALSPAQDDEAVLSVVATDAVGNVSDPTPVTVDAKAPEAPSVNPSGGKSVSGTAEPGATVTVRGPDGAVIGTGVADRHGDYSIQLTPAQPDAAVLAVTATDGIGNESTPTLVTVDAVAPDAPHVEPPTGVLLKGTSEPGTSITVRDRAGNIIGTAVTDDEHQFSVDLHPAQPHDAVLFVTATDAVGNVSTPTAATVDARAPDAPAVDRTNGKVVSGTAELGSLVQVRDAGGNVIGRGAVDADGGFMIRLSPAQPHGVVLSLTATDGLGNESEPSAATVDALAPVVVVDPTDGKSVSGTTEPGARITVRDPQGDVIGTGTADADGNYTIPLPAEQPDGAELSVTAADAVGNESDPTPVTVDALAPAAPAVNPTNGKTVSGTTEPGATVTVRDPQGHVIGTGTADHDGDYTIPLAAPQPDGAELSVTAMDRVGNESEPIRVTVDAEAPVAPAVKPTDGKTVSGVTEPGATVTVRDPQGDVIGTGTADTDGNYSIPLDVEQPDGAELSVTATDPAGNESEPAPVTVDAAAPAAPAANPTDGKTVSGTTEPGATVTVRDPQGDVIGTGTADRDGNYTVPLADEQPDGAELSVTATDAVGNESDPTPVTVDAVAPAAPAVNPTNGKTLSGTAEPGATVTVRGADGEPIGTATADDDGNYTIPLDAEQPDGVELSVTATDAAGNESTPASATVDAVAPTAPHVDPSNGKTVAGTTEPGATVTVRDADGDVVGTGTADADGTYSIPLPDEQPDAAQLSVTATDPAGNESDPTPVTVDAEAPVAPGVNPTNGKTIAGTAEPGATVTVRDPDGDVIGTGTADRDGNYTIPLTDEQPHAAQLSVTATDLSGNQSEPSSATVDAQAPIVVVDPTDGKTVSGTSEPGATVTVRDADGQVIGTGTVEADGTYAITLDAVQLDGVELSVTAVDTVGNESDPTPATVDAEVPAAPGVNATNGRTVSGITEPGARVTVRDPAGDVIGTGTADEDGNYSIPLAAAQRDGAELAVTATDLAGNESDPTTVTVDALAPDAPGVNPTNGKTVSGTTEPGATVTVRDPQGDVIGTGTADEEGNYSIPLAAAQPDGAELSVTARDTVGNESEPSSVTVDASAPAAPAVNPTNGKTVSGTTEPGAKVTVRDLAGDVIGTATADEDGHYIIPLTAALPDGAELSVTATDPAGNESEPTPVTVDALAPGAPGVNPTNGKTVSGTTEPGATVTVRDPQGDVIGTGTADADGNYSIPLTAEQADGVELSVTATDPAGNESDPTPATVDAEAPGAPGVNPTNGKTVSGTTEPGATVTVRDADGDVIGTGTADRDGNYTIPLAVEQPDGAELSVTATDPAGNESPRPSVAVDAVAPDAPHVDPTNGKTVSGATEPGAIVTVRDPQGEPIGTATADDDGNYTIPLTAEQPDGAELSVTATDPAGNESEPSPVTVDALAPDAPAVNPTNGKTVTGTAEPGASVIVRDAAGQVVGRGVAADDGVFTIDLVPRQEHGAEITVTAIDAVGNESAPTQATVDDVAPTAPTVNPSNGKTVSGAAEPGATVTVRDPDGQVVGTAIADEAGKFTVSLEPVQPDGAALTVTATDPAGNESAATPVTVDAVGPAAPQVDPSNGKSLSGTAEPGAVVVARDADGDPIGSTTADENGRFTIALEPAQPDRATVAVTAADAAGNESDATSVRVDAAAPDRPIIELADVDRVSGTAEPGATITVADANGLVVGTGEVDSEGRFEIAFPVGVPVGTTISVTATDGAGNEATSDAVTIPFRLLTIVLDRGELRTGQLQGVTATGFFPGERVEGVMRSQPFPLGTRVADANGVVTFQWSVPEGTQLGDHRAILTGELSGVVAGGFRVVGDAATDTRPAFGWLALTGADSLPFLGAALVALLAGLSFILFAAARRRRRETEEEAR